MLSESLCLHKNKLMNGENVTEEWRKVTNKHIADNLAKSIAELLDGEVHHQLMVDYKGVTQRKISIIYTEDEK